MRSLVFLLWSAMLPTGVAAGPNPQLLALIENRLPYYDLRVDVSQLTTRQAAALHMTMVSDGDDWFEKRRRLRTILSWDKEDDQ